MSTRLIKAYTRDTTMVIQQAWITALETHKERIGIPGFEDAPLSLHYLTDGVIEIWENEAWTPALMDRMLELNTNEPERFARESAAHEKNVAWLTPFWKKGVADSVEELSSVTDHIFEHMHLFDWMYYAALDERTPPALKSEADALRTKDVYFDETDRFIRKSLVTLYPELAGYEQGILRSEISAPPSLAVLKDRFRNFVVVGERESVLTTLPAYAAERGLELVREEAPAAATELRGQVASKGSAKGRVRIVKRKDQVGAMEEGEILVSTMTTPDFVPAMRKAAAIVTDEGGIMCHAAILSRELKVPCVIGTKVATKLLKDGDMVEVDAEQGIVRKI